MKVVLKISVTFLLRGAVSMVMAGCAEVLNYSEEVKAINGGLDRTVELRYSKPKTLSVSNKKSISIAHPNDSKLPRKYSGFASRADFFVLGKPANNNVAAGTPKTGYVVTEDSISDWVSAAVRAELDAAGYDAVVVRELPCQMNVGIEIDVDDVSIAPAEVNFLTQGEASYIKLTVRLYKGSMKVVKRFKIENFSQPNYSRTKSLEAALRGCIEKLVTEINLIE
jgi:hypothetical protein